MDTVTHYSILTEIRAVILIGWIGIRKSKFYEWRKRYGKVNEHNALVPRDFWIEEWERHKIIAFYLKHRDDGYGSQFISRDFKELVRILDMRPVNTSSPYYPQSNGKIEHFFGTLKKEAVKPRTPLSLEDARRVMEEYIEIYNNIRPNSAIEYIAPKEKVEGREKIIFDERDRRL